MYGKKVKLRITFLIILVLSLGLTIYLVLENLRENVIYFENVEYKVIIGIPKIDWPENWAWKDSVISDNAVDPVVRESVYRTIHRVVSKIIIENQQGMILMAETDNGELAFVSPTKEIAPGNTIR